MSTRPPLNRLSIPPFLVIAPTPQDPADEVAAPGPEAPDPALHRIAAGFYRVVAEALIGRRPLAQLLPLLDARPAAVVHGLAAQHPGARLSGVRCQAPRPGVIESTAHVSTGTGTWALATRLECHRGRWRAVAFEVAVVGERRPRR